MHARPKAWECGVYRQYLSRSSPRIVFVSARAACHDLDHWSSAPPAPAFSLGHGPAHLSWAKNRTMVANWRDSTTRNAAATCTWSAGTGALSCVPSPSSAKHVRDWETPLMMRRVSPIWSLHGGLSACSALLHLALWHGHRYRVVTSSCLSHRGHASRRRCHSPRCSGTSTMPVSGDSRRSCSIRGWRAPGGLHLLGA